MADIDRFLIPVSEGEPCGEETPAFRELLIEIRDAVAPKAEMRVVTSESGNRQEEMVAKEVNWKTVRSLCEKALARSRHLDVCLTYTAALLDLEGLPGAAAGLELIDQLLQRYWEQIFPRLDPEDPDPGQRISLVENLSIPPGYGGDPLDFVRRLRCSPLCSSRRAGLEAFSLATFQGRSIPAPGSPEANTMRSDFGAFFQAAQAEPGGAERIAENQHAVQRALDALQSIKKYLGERPSGREPNLDQVINETLTKQWQVFELFAGIGANGSTKSPGGSQEVIPTDAKSPNRSEAEASPRQSIGPSGEVRGSADVVAMLDKICAYYRTAEPSSPVPLLLLRARRLVGRSFLDVIGDLAASSVEDIKKITGEMPANQ